jgi:hypothetical protein
MSDKVWLVEYTPSAGTVFMVECEKPMEWAEEHKPTPDATYEIYHPHMCPFCELLGNGPWAITNESYERMSQQGITPACVPCMYVTKGRTVEQVKADLERSAKE